MHALLWYHLSSDFLKGTTTTTSVKSSKHYMGPTLDPLKNRNIGLICLKMSVVPVWIPVYVCVKYLSICINIDEMPAV